MPPSREPVLSTPANPKEHTSACLSQGEKGGGEGMEERASLFPLGESTRRMENSLCTLAPVLSLCLTEPIPPNHSSGSLSNPGSWGLREEARGQGLGEFLSVPEWQGRQEGAGTGYGCSLSVSPSLHTHSNQCPLPSSKNSLLPDLAPHPILTQPSILGSWKPQEMASMALFLPRPGGLCVCCQPHSYRKACTTKPPSGPQIQLHCHKCHQKKLLLLTQKLASLSPTFSPTVDPRQARKPASTLA